MALKISEQDIGRATVSWLRADGWDVYQEVKVGKYGQAPTADIVAVREPLTWIVECKTSLSLALLDQVLRWHRRKTSHLISVSAPTWSQSDAALWMLGELGIGHFRYAHGELMNDTAPTLLRNKFDPKRLDLRSYLHPDQMTRVDAGSACGGSSTPFARTCDQIRKLVVNGPVPVKEVMSKIRHHYACDSTARSCLVMRAKAEQIKGIRVVRDGRRLLFAEAP